MAILCYISNNWFLLKGKLMKYLRYEIGGIDGVDASLLEAAGFDEPAALADAVVLPTRKGWGAGQKHPPQP